MRVAATHFTVSAPRLPNSSAFRFRVCIKQSWLCKVWCKFFLWYVQAFLTILCYAFNCIILSLVQPFKLTAMFKSQHASHILWGKQVFVIFCSTISFCQCLLSFDICSKRPGTEISIKSCLHSWGRFFYSRFQSYVSNAWQLINWCLPSCAIDFPAVWNCLRNIFRLITYLYVVYKYFM